MSNEFKDAIVASMTASLDPNNLAIRDFIKATVEEKRTESAVSKAQAILSINAQIKKAKEDGNDGNVIEALNKVLQSLG